MSSGRCPSSRHAYERQNERNPHEEVEATKDIIERLFPILGWWRTDDVSAILYLALNDGIVQAVHGVSGITGADLFWGDEVDVYARDGIGWIRASLGLSRQLFFLDTNRKGSITTKKALRKRQTTSNARDSPDLNAIARDFIPPRVRNP